MEFGKEAEDRFQELQKKLAEEFINPIIKRTMKILEREGFMDINGHLVKIDLNKVDDEP